MQSTHPSRPKRYTPTEVERICVYLLARQSDFVGAVNDELSNIRYVCFKNANGSNIYFFNTVKDRDDTRNPYPALNEFIAYIKRFINDNRLSERDVIIAPLVLVKNGRNHFNTLVIAGFHDKENDRSLVCRLIEPKGHVEYLGKFYLPCTYPYAQTRQTIINELRSGDTPVDVDCNLVLTGLQNAFNSSDCGAHLINAVETVSKLPAVDIWHVAHLKRAIRGNTLSKRQDDGEILASLHACENEESIVGFVEAQKQNNNSQPDNIISI